MDSISLEDHKDRSESLAEPLAEPSEEMDKKASIKLATEVFLTLSKAVKTLKLYPDTSPLRQRFMAELTEKFNRFLDEYGDLIMKVKQTEFLYQGEVVYSYPSTEENIAFKFYGDGIRELAFTEGLEEKEILDFIDVIMSDDVGEGGDDDTVTMLWEKDFKNIRYSVIEEGEDSGRLPIIPEKTLTSENSREALRRAFQSEAGAQEKGKIIVEPAGAETEIEHIYGKPFNEIFTLTPEEIEKVQQEMEREEGMDLISELLDILFHILQIEKDINSYSEIMKNIEKALKTLVLSGDYKRVIPILTTLKTLSKEENNFSAAHALEIYKTVDALGDEKFLQQLALSINTSKAEYMEALFSFLTMLNKNAIAPLASMVGALDQMKTRRLFCDVLAQLARDNIEPLLKKLNDNNWYVVRNIVYVLGKIGDARAIPYLERIKGHEEYRVRKEIVHTLVEIKSEKAKDLMISFINDNNSSVRIMALKNLTTLDYKKALSPILNIISSDSFNGKEVVEKKEFFEALGVLGSRDILSYLKETLMKRSWFFGKSKNEEQRIYAVLALRKMSTPEAINILREGSVSSDKGIRKICEDALQEIEKDKK